MMQLSIFRQSHKAALPTFLGTVSVHRPDRNPARLQELLEAVDYKIGLLEIVDRIFGLHDALQIKGDAVGRMAFERKYAFDGGRQYPGAKDAQPGRGADRAPAPR
jgi:hypothetical protein